MSNDDAGKTHVKTVAAAVGTRIGASLGSAIGASWHIPATSIFAVPLGGVVLGATLLYGGGAIIGGIVCYKIAQKFLDDKKG